MDRLIWTAWRAFWVGLGAALVLIAQSLLSAPPSGRLPASTDASVCPVPARPADGFVTHRASVHGES